MDVYLQATYLDGKAYKYARKIRFWFQVSIFDLIWDVITVRGAFFFSNIEIEGSYW